MKYTKLKKEFINYFVYKSGEKKGFIDTSFDLVWKWITKNFVAKSEHSEDKLGMSKQKLTGKDSGNLPNTKNKAGGSSKSALNFPLSNSRPKPNKIEEIKDYDDVKGFWTKNKTNIKINEIIQVINYLLEKEK